MEYSSALIFLGCLSISKTTFVNVEAEEMNQSSQKI